ncbi:MAG: ice-binding family protein [bacterium]
MRRAYATAGTDQGSALASLAAEPCTFTFAAGAINLSTDVTHGPIGVYTPGVYCSTGAMDVGGPLTLNGSGTYIFRPIGALTSTVGAIVTLVGASACDVFWTPSAATTLAANTTFAGTVISDAGITIGANTTWSGRALAYGGTVTTDTTTITAPTCTTDVVIPPPMGGSVRRYGTVTAVKLVVNDNAGTKTIPDFPLYINGILVSSGVTHTYNVLDAPFAIREPLDSQYTHTFSGDCDVNGNIAELENNDAKVCIVTNDDIGAPVVVPPVPPLIDVVKVPSPLALPDGPGLVNYTYTLKNIGTVPVTGVTMVGDICSPIILASGDVNNDAKLDLNETWIYRCSEMIPETRTNTVVATGWANGISATDVASATVVVGIPDVVPPLIHVTKIPSPLALLAGGGMVTYTFKVTNPGTVALTNVGLTDDKCGPRTFVSGDQNGDAKLDPTETWTYTCRMNLTRTTTNTATASGEANGLRVRDIAAATVVVAGIAPALPNTGAIPASLPLVGLAVSIGLLAAFALMQVLIQRKRLS